MATATTSAITVNASIGGFSSAGAEDDFVVANRLFFPVSNTSARVHRDVNGGRKKLVIGFMAGYSHSKVSTSRQCEEYLQWFNWFLSSKYY